MVNFNQKMIPVIFTTIQRSKLAIDTINNLLHYNFLPVIGIQGIEPDLVDFIADLNKKEEKILFLQLPYDCGLSYSRNILVDYLIKNTNYTYFILSADSIQMTVRAEKLLPLLDYMKQLSIDILALELENRVSWEGYLDLIPKQYFVIKPIKKDKDIVFCDIVRNFFIGNLYSVKKVRWDNELKLCEHEDFFWRAKLTKLNVVWINFKAGKYVNFKPRDYNKLRIRMYNEFRKKLQKKYNINGWVKYERK